MRVGIPTYIWLQNVASSCLPSEAPFPLSNPEEDEWRGCQAGLVNGRENGPYPIIWPTLDARLEDKVVRQSGTRHRAVAGEKIVVDLGDGTSHTCWTEAVDIAAAERALDRQWMGNKGVAAPGIRFVTSRPDDRSRDAAVYPQDADCAVVYKEPGTYTLTLTIHWRAWRWETGPWPNRPKLEVTDELPPEHATTSASIQVGVCELHTIPTHRPPKPGPPKPGPPKPGTARSCITGDVW